MPGLLLLLLSDIFYKTVDIHFNIVISRILSIDKNKISGTEVYDIWGKFYVSGNVVEGNDAATNDNWNFGVYNQFHGSYGTVSDADKTNMKLSQP